MARTRLGARLAGPRLAGKRSLRCPRLGRRRGRNRLAWDLGLAALVAAGLEDGECLGGPVFGLTDFDAGEISVALTAVFGLTPSLPGLLFGFCTLFLLKIDLPSTGADECSRSGSSQTRI
jgi:hypothetical protein